MRLLLTILFFTTTVGAESSAKKNANVAEYEKIQACITQVQKLCENDKNKDKDCPQKKWPQLPANCKQYSSAATYMNPDNILTGKNLPQPMGNCLQQLQKLCTFDNALAQKDLGKAGKKYQTCLENAVPKMSGECKKILNGNL